MAYKTAPNWAFGLLATFVAASALTIWKNGGIGSNGLADTLMFVAFFALMIWLVVPRSDKTGSGQGLDEGFALRLGKALKRILRPLKG